jgi:hypothetical protein
MRCHGEEKKKQGQPPETNTDVDVKLYLFISDRGDFEESWCEVQLVVQHISLFYKNRF